MAKAIATRELVFEAAQQLHNEGIDPSIISVKDRIGGGSYSTINNFLNVWKIDQAKRSQRAFELPKEISERATELIGTLWETATQLATNEIEEIKAKAFATVARSQADLAEATREIERLEKITNEQEATIQQQSTQIHALDRKLASVESEACRAKSLEKRLDETKLALVTAEQEAIVWKTQAEQADSLASVVANLQQRIEAIPIPTKK